MYCSHLDQKKKKKNDQVIDCDHTMSHLVTSIRNNPNMSGISSFKMKDYFKRIFWRALEKQGFITEEVNL